MKKEVFYFAIALSVLMIGDFLTTNYAISQGHIEQNPFMDEIVLNPYLFLLIKIAGTGIIIYSISKLNTQSPKVSHFTMRFISIMMILVVAGNLFVISASAIPFYNLTGTIGAIGNGNGYFDNEQLAFNITSVKNVYLLAEPYGISIVEPLGYATGQSGANLLITKGNNNIRYAMVASDGNIYYSDGDGLKMRNTRSSTATYEANDTYDQIVNPSGTSTSIITSANIYSFSEVNGNIYFVDGNFVKHFPLDGRIVQTDYDYTAVPGTKFTDGKGVAFFEINGTVTALGSRSNSAGCSFDFVNSSIGWEYLTSNAYCGGVTNLISSFESENYIYASEISALMANPGIQVVFNKANIHAVPWVVGNRSGEWDNYSSVHLGSNSVYALYVDGTTNTYNVFNFFEPGTLKTTTTQPELTYATSFVQSIYPIYYNNSQFKIEYGLNFSVDYTKFDIPVIGEDTLLYSHRIDLTDPNGTYVGTYPIKVTCPDTPTLIDIVLYPSALYTCTASETFHFQSSTPWKNGTYTVDLIEKTLETGVDATLSTDSFNVLNEKGTLAGIGGNQPGGTTPSNPNQPITSNEIVSLLQNNTFWAFILTIGCMVAIGIIAGRGNNNPTVPMAMGGFLGLAVTSFIGWMPLWITFATILIVLVAASWEYAKNSNTGGGQ